MSPIKEGEKLMLLVKRDARSAEEIADAMGIDKSYLPKLYKMEKLPRKSRQKAERVFQVEEQYFLAEPEKVYIVAEPGGVYKSAAPPGDADATRLQAENAALRDEVARLSKMLDQEKATNTALAEAILNMSKRS